MVYNTEEQWKPIASVVGKILLTKVLELEKPDKTGLLLLANFVVYCKKKHDSLKIKNYIK